MKEKQIRRTASAALALMIAAGAVPFADNKAPFNGLTATVSAEGEATSGTCGANAAWEFDIDTGELTISGTGDMNDYDDFSTVPWLTYALVDNEKPYLQYIKSIVIESGITSIGVNAFTNCNGLESVTICGNITKIGDGAFFGCAFSSIVLPDSIESIGSNAFGEMYNTLKTIYYCGTAAKWADLSAGAGLPAGVQVECNYTPPADIDEVTWKITDDGTLVITGTGAMENYSSDTAPWYSQKDSITSVEIGSGITRIGDMAFSGCMNLKTIDITGSIASIGSAPFENCSSLATIYYHGTKEQWAATGAGQYVPDGTDVIFYDEKGGCGDNAVWTLDSDGLLTISGTGAMTAYTYQSNMPWSSYTDNIKSVVVKDGITSIDENAFYSCTNLTSAVIADSVTSIGGSAFGACRNLTSVTLGSSLESIGDSVFDSCAGLSSIILPDGVTSIGDDAFHGCSSLASIDIPDSVTSIGDDAFHGCSSLASIDIPDSVTSIGTWAFCSCSSLTSINIPDSVTSIGDSAFYNCSNLTSVDISDSVTSIGIEAFYNCSSLTSIDIPYGVKSIGDRAFYNCSSLTSIDIPYGVKSIGNGAFSYCSNLTYIDIPDGVTSIGNNAFENCSSLASIDIPDGITSIGIGAFYGCSNLTYIDIPDRVTSIGEQAFTGSGLTSVSIPGGVETIENFTFQECQNLKDIVFSEGVQEIKDSAFADCSALESITIPSTMTGIAFSAFNGCYSLQTIYCENADDSYVQQKLYSILPNEVWNACQNNIRPIQKMHTIDMPDDSSVKASYYSSGDQESYGDFKVDTSVDTICFDSDKLFRVFCGNTQLIEAELYSSGEYKYRNSLDISQNPEPTSYTVVEQTLEQDQIIGLNEKIKVWNNEYYKVGDTKYRFAQNDTKWKKTTVKLQNVDGQYTINNIPICKITNGEYTKGELYVSSGNGTGDDPYIFKERVRYIYTGNNTPMTGGISNVHAGDVLYRDFGYDGDLKIDVTSSNSSGLILTSDKPFYVRKAGAPTYYPAVENANTGLWTLDSNSRIEDITLYEQAKYTGFEGTFLSLDGDIGVNACFYFNNVDALSPNTSVTIQVGNKAPVTYSVGDGTHKTLTGIDNKTYTVYSFRINCAAKEMTDEITVTWTDSTRTEHTETSFTIKSVAQEYIKDPDTAAVAKALLNYGAYSQEYFGYNTDKLANSELNADDKDVTVADPTMISSGYDKATEYLPNDLEFSKVNLTLDTETALNLYFTDNTGKNVTYSSDLGDVSVSQYNGYTKVAVKNIPSEKLGDTITITIKVDDDDSTYSVRYSPMIYAYNQCTRDGRPQGLKECMQAFYKYYEAAKTYSESLS